MSEAAAHTVDAFHRGEYVVVQPARRGHRSGTDAMMLAAAVPAGFAGRLVDLGAGAGAAGLAVAARCRSAEVVLVENAPEMADCARQSLAHPANAALASRCSLIEADVRLRGRARAQAGLADCTFDWAIMNPPFNSAADRASPDALRRQAHVMDGDDLFADWLRAAAALVRPGGGVAVIARPGSLAGLILAMRNRFGHQEARMLHPRADRPATRFVLRARRDRSTGLSIVPPLILHVAEGHGFTAEADAINNGRASLFGD